MTAQQTNPLGEDPPVNSEAGQAATKKIMARPGQAQDQAQAQDRDRDQAQDEPEHAHAHEPLDMEAIDASLGYVASTHLTISSGTVCVDPDRAKVLLIWHRLHRIWQLPKGRKALHEHSLLAAALRETAEETGVRARPWPLAARTRSSPPAPGQARDALVEEALAALATEPNGNGGNGNGNGNGGSNVEMEVIDGVLGGVMAVEPLAMTRCPDPQAPPGTEKVVFYFAARADSAEAPGPQSASDSRKIRPEWVGLGRARARLRFRADRLVLDKAVEDARRSGFALVEEEGGDGEGEDDGGDVDRIGDGEGVDGRLV